MNTNPNPDQLVIDAHLGETPRHTVRGQTSDSGFPYGSTHDHDCPACTEYFGDDFQNSPRSESYWAS